MLLMCNIIKSFNQNVLSWYFMKKTFKGCCNLVFHIEKIPSNVQQGFILKKLFLHLYVNYVPFKHQHHTWSNKLKQFVG